MDHIAPPSVFQKAMRTMGEYLLAWAPQPPSSTRELTEPPSGLLGPREVANRPFPPPFSETRPSLGTAQSLGFKRLLKTANDIGNDITVDSTRPANTEGHFCDLYIGTHPIWGKVALKRPRVTSREGYAEDQIRRFSREGDTWKELQHDYILLFLGVCQIKGDIYLVSPFMDNGTLPEFLKANPDADRARFVREIAEALAYMHGRGAVHGDIKGNNILISKERHVQLMDFGLAKLESNMATSTALHGAGAPRWQSPEVIEGSPKSFESDVYAFAMTVVEVLTGDVPLRKYRDSLAVARAVIERDERPLRPPASSSMDAAYARVWDLVELCWAKDPTDRLPMSVVVELLHDGRDAVRRIAALRRTQSASGSEYYQAPIIVNLADPDLAVFDAITILRRKLDTAIATETSVVRVLLREGDGMHSNITGRRLEIGVRKLIAGYVSKGTVRTIESGKAEENCLTLLLRPVPEPQPQHRRWASAAGRG